MYCCLVVGEGQVQLRFSTERNSNSIYCLIIQSDYELTIVKEKPHEIKGSQCITHIIYNGNFPFINPPLCRSTDRGLVYMLG